ncbi:MAG: serine/threonine protein kinase [Stackebrandtia sp.]
MFPLADHDPRTIGRYRLLAVLGEGGMGRVYLGYDSDRRWVAVKRILPQFSRDDGFRRRFALEVRAATQVTGASTVKVVDSDVDASEPWLASEFIPGPTLIQAVDAGGPLPEAYVRRIAMDLAAALAGVHDAGLIHRDIKPPNVILPADGARLLDFGVSRALDYSTSVAVTQTGGVVGSPGFMSPEQATSSDLSQKSDVFSLGCLLATAASGHVPFAGASIPQVLYQVVHTEPNLDGVPASLRPVIERCLTKDPAERPGAREVHDDLEQSGEPSDGTPQLVTDFIARQNSEIANLLPPPAPADTLVDTGPTLASPPPVWSPLAAGASNPRRAKVLIAAMAVAVVLVIAVPLWIVLGSDSASDGADAGPSLKLPSDVCDALDVKGLKDQLDSDDTVDEPQSGIDSSKDGDDAVSCGAMVTYDGDPQSGGYSLTSFDVFVAKTTSDSGKDYVCRLKGCDGVESLAKPFGKVEDRPWSDGAIVEDDDGHHTMMWYQEDLAVLIEPNALFQDGTSDDQKFLVGQAVSLYDFIADN